MADPTISDRNPASVAYALMRDVLSTSAKLDRGSIENGMTEKDLLDLYARCLDATTGKRLNYRVPNTT